MKAKMLLIAGLLQIGCLIMLAQAPGSTEQTKAEDKSTQQSTPAGTQNAQQARGEKEFQQNCSRCHNAPTELPTQSTGTVLLHMRVRASLSAADERDILHYLAP
jgi:cytochrome c5